MPNIEFGRFIKETNLEYKHALSDSLKSGETDEMLVLSGDIGRALPIETVQKLCDCYAEMITEVRERLQNLYADVLGELHVHQYGGRLYPSAKCGAADVDERSVPIINRVSAPCLVAGRLRPMLAR